tara:strand:+ start:370 stop:2337 length:1968 start_codon:yes stop_codon:yes gene_type:complete
MKKNIKRDSNGRFSKNRSEFSFVNLATYTSPEVIEVKNKEWVQYGADNNYFQFLIDRYNGSPTNNACINGISQAVYGKGLNATDANKKPMEYAQMITLLKPDVVRKVSYDLKLMGQAAIQVIYSKDRSKIALCEHFPIETLRAEKANEEGDVTGYYYWNDWTSIKPSDKPLRIPAFGTSKENIEIMYIKPYKSGFYYYSPVDYQGGLQYCELEEEISNYHLNNILNGLAPSMLINFNNGTPNQEQRELIEARIAEKFSGSSNAGKFILAFNDNKESQAEITPVQLSDAHNQYQFLSTESQSKILVAHRVVSPMLLGIKDNTGLGNNADEIKTASLLMDNTVIRPFQELLIDSFDKLLAYNDIALNLYFITLQPLEFTDVDRSLQDSEAIEEETGVKMSNNKIKLKKIDGFLAYKTIEEAEAQAKIQNCEGYHEHKENDEVWYMPCKSHPVELSEEKGNSILQNLEGEIIDKKEWELVDEIKSNSEYSDEDWANYLIKEKKSLFRRFADEITANPNGFSYLDSKNYKVRYKYAVGSTKQSSSSRAFCVNMMSLSRGGTVYRIERIDKAGREGVNQQLGHNGQPYDLFKFKGGVYCRHIWNRVLYRLKANTKPSDNLGSYKKTKTIPASYLKSPRGAAESIIAPVNMDNEGHYPGVK